MRADDFGSIMPALDAMTDLAGDMGQKAWEASLLATHYADALIAIASRFEHRPVRCHRLLDVRRACDRRVRPAVPGAGGKSCVGGWLMKLSMDLQLTPAQLAEAFCEMGDEQQAQFFIEAARIARDTWVQPATFMQWRAVGKHLRTCACSSDDARELVRDIAEGIGTP